MLRRTRIVLNIHFYRAKVLELCRILEAISFGAVVRSVRPLPLCQVHKLLLLKATMKAHALVRWLFTEDAGLS